mgnify:FL=1
MKIRLNLFPEGRKRALTMSYDDGADSDERLVEIFNRCGIKGTFHLNSSRLNLAGMERNGKKSGLYEGHEVSAHTKSHPHPKELPDTELIEEILGDRTALEELCGYPVRGMSYPFGEYTEHIMEIARLCGMEYGRTVAATGGFALPENFMEWHPTAHHNADLQTLWDRFMRAGSGPEDPELLFYLWGHSFEFDRQDNWQVIENFCRMAGGRDDIWYATNIEIKDYVTALRGLVFGAKRDMAYNPSCIDVWITADGQPVRVKAGSLTLW